MSEDQIIAGKGRSAGGDKSAAQIMFPSMDK